MSTRQRNRLLQKAVLEKSREEDDEEEEEAPDAKVSTFKAAFADDSESEESESEESETKGDEGVEDEIPVVEVSTNKIVRNFPKDVKKEGKEGNGVDEELEYLNSLLSAKAEASSGITGDSEVLTSVFAHISCKLFAVDSKQLDIDVVMRRRFGGLALQDQGNNQGGQQQRGGRNLLRTTKSILTKRLMFGSPKLDWPLKPPTFISGGMGMTKVTNSETSVFTEFKFEWSSDYKRLQDKFNSVQNSGDANLLVMFLAQNPFHIDGLLQLAMIFARTGHMDRYNVNFIFIGK